VAFTSLQAVRGRKNARASPLRTYTDVTHDRNFHLRSVSPVLFCASWSGIPWEHSNSRAFIYSTLAL